MKVNIAECGAPKIDSYKTQRIIPGFYYSSQEGSNLEMTVLVRPVPVPQVRKVIFRSINAALSGRNYKSDHTKSFGRSPFYTQIDKIAQL